MARVFQRRRRRNGQLVTEKKYTVEWRDASGRCYRQAAYTDKSESWALARKLENDAQAGQVVKHRRTPLAEHLEAFRRSLQSKERTIKHIQITCNRIARVFDNCIFIQLADVNISPIEEWLDEQRSLRIGIKTRNYYVASVKQFFTWMVRTKRAFQNPVLGLETLNAEADIRRVRRVLTHAELEKLIIAARSGNPFRGISGEDRAILYLLAVRTGLRKSECASLTAKSFDLPARTVTVTAAYSKRRRKDTLPLRADIVEILTEWLRGRTGKLWPGTWHERGAWMIRRDLESAGIPYENEQGVFDFHSLRHQFLSDLASSGVHPKVAQELARHSTIALTMDRYSHVLEDQKTEAIERLPVLGEWTAKWTETFGVDCPQGAQVVTMGGEGSCPPESIEVVEREVVSTDCHKVARTDSSSGGRSRTYDTRIMIPLL